MISVQKAKQLDATTMFTYSHANTALGQSERAYYLSYFIKVIRERSVLFHSYGNDKRQLNSVFRLILTLVIRVRFALCLFVMLLLSPHYICTSLLRW